MGGFSDVLGHVATGYTQAAQVDKQRQFEAEMQHRNEVSGLLQKLAFDPNTRPEIANAAVGEIGNIHNQPITKAYKFDPYKSGIVRNAETHQQTMPGLQQPAAPPGGAPQPSFTESPNATMPAGVAGPPDTASAAAAPQMSMPAPPPSLAGIAMQGAGPMTVSTPGGPQPMFYTPQERAAQAANAIGQATRAQNEQTMHGQIYTQPIPGGPLTVQPISGAGTTMGTGVPNAISPWQLQGKGLSKTTYTTPDDPNAVKFGTYNEFTREITGEDGKVVPNAQQFQPSLVQKTTDTGQSMDTAGGIHTHRTTGPSASAGGGKSAGTSSVTSAKSAGSPHITSSSFTDWQNSKDPRVLDAIDWATKGRVPKGGPMAERQVRVQMKQMGLEPALPVPPSLQQKIQQSFVARNSAIGLIDDIQKNSDVLNSLISAGKIQTAINPSTGAAVVTRAADLSDKEANVAGDYQQLVEHVNLLRGPLGATGFRGPEAWAALQAQRGNIMSDPRITRQVLSGMRDRLIGLNNADKMVLTGHGMDASGVPSAPPSGTRSVGDVVSVKGQKIKITAIHPDGTFDGEPQ